VFNKEHKGRVFNLWVIVRFEATFGSVSGKFLGYYDTETLSLSFDDYVSQLREDVAAAMSFEKDGLWDWNLGPEEARKRTLSLGLNFSLPNMLLR
jgi:hypothetical protein